MNEWNIQSRAHACQACEKGFTDKEQYHTLLLTNKHELQRLDICQSCWETKQSGTDNERKGFISCWRGIYHAPTAAPVEAIQKESAETLLRKLIEANDPKHGPACYILAVMLERKRLLKVKEQIKTEGSRVFVYEQPKTGDIFTITDPDLQLNQLEEVQRDVADLLAHGLPSQPLAEVAAPLPETSQLEAPVAALEEVPAQGPENALTETPAEPLDETPESPCA